MTPNPVITPHPEAPRTLLFIITQPSNDEIQQSFDMSQQSLQPLQPPQPQPAPRASYTPTTSYQHPGTPPGPISGNDIAAAMRAQFGLNPSSTIQLSQQQSTFGKYPGTSTAAVPAIDVDPSIRAAAGRHPMIGAFVEALDELSARRA